MKCPMCHGPGGMLGELGNLRHFRCRNCGMDFSKRIKSKGAAPAPRAAALPAPPPRKPSRSSGSGRVNPLLTREGTVVRFEPTAASALLYSHAPPAGTLGTTASMNLPGAGRKVYIRGPGGGLVYVGWDGYGTQGVSPMDLEVVSASKPRKNPAPKGRRRKLPSRAGADPTTRMIQHGMCDAWLCTNIAQYETRSERGEARRLCKKCLRVVAQAEANKASGCAPRENPTDLSRAKQYHPDTVFSRYERRIMAEYDLHDASTAHDNAALLKTHGGNLLIFVGDEDNPAWSKHHGRSRYLVLTRWWELLYKGSDIEKVRQILDGARA